MLKIKWSSFLFRDHILWKNWEKYLSLQVAVCVFVCVCFPIVFGSWLNFLRLHRAVTHGWSRGFRQKHGETKQGRNKVKSDAGLQWLPLNIPQMCTSHTFIFTHFTRKQQLQRLIPDGRFRQRGSIKWERCTINKQATSPFHTMQISKLFTSVFSINSLKDLQHALGEC